jgi:hypothetical protein
MPDIPYPIGGYKFHEKEIMVHETYGTQSLCHGVFGHMAHDQHLTGLYHLEQCVVLLLEA